MRKEDKSTIIEQIAATVKEYGHFYLVDTTAMNAADTSALRALCFKADIKLMVVKNTLLHKALESLEEDYSPLYGCMKGTTAVMFCNTANAPAKLLKDKAKNVKRFRRAWELSKLPANFSIEEYWRLSTSERAGGFSTPLISM